MRPVFRSTPADPDAWKTGGGRCGDGSPTIRKRSSPSEPQPLAVRGRGECRDRGRAVVRCLCGRGCLTGLRRHVAGADGHEQREQQDVWSAEAAPPLSVRGRGCELRVASCEGSVGAAERDDPQLAADEIETVRMTELAARCDLLRAVRSCSTDSGARRPVMTVSAGGTGVAMGMVPGCRPPVSVSCALRFVGHAIPAMSTSQAIAARPAIVRMGRRVNAGTTHTESVAGDSGQ